MEKYFALKDKGSSCVDQPKVLEVSVGNNDILTQLRAAEHLPPSDLALCQAWKPYESSASRSTVECTKKKKPTGWSTRDGKKEYSTFRNGKGVSGTGKDGMVLALGDKLVKSNKKRKLGN